MGIGTALTTWISRAVSDAVVVGAQDGLQRLGLANGDVGALQGNAASALAFEALLGQRALPPAPAADANKPDEQAKVAAREKAGGRK